MPVPLTVGECGPSVGALRSGRGFCAPDMFLERPPFARECSSAAVGSKPDGSLDPMELALSSEDRQSRASENSHII